MTNTFPDEQLDTDLERVAFVLYQQAGGMDTPRMSSASDREFYLPRAQAILDALNPPCVMRHQPPMDFAWCDTHDETFPLGEKCRFDGRKPWEVYADEADEQRQRAVRLELEVEEYDPILTRQGELLTRTVNAIKGAPPRLTTWSHHDIPELAAAVVAERDAHRAEVERLTEQNDSLLAHKDEAERLTDWSNDLAERMPPEFDGDEAQEYLIDNWITSLITEREAAVAQRGEALAEAQRLQTMAGRVDALAEEVQGWDLTKFTAVQVANRIRSATNGEGWGHRAEVERLRAALEDVVQNLGPDRICECDPYDEGCGLRNEAEEALTVAKTALEGKDHR